MMNRQPQHVLRTIRPKKTEAVLLDEMRNELLSIAELLQLAASGCRVEVDSRNERVLLSELVDAARQAVKQALDHQSEEPLGDVRLGLLRIYSLLLIVQSVASDQLKDAGGIVSSPLADTLEIAVELAYGLAGRVATRVHAAQAVAAVPAREPSLGAAAVRDRRY